MTNDEERFVAALIELVRDRAIIDADVTRVGRTPDARRWQALIDAGDVDQLLDRVIADTVDTTIFYLLDAIDGDELPPTYAAPAQVAEEYIADHDVIRTRSSQRSYPFDV